MLQPAVHGYNDLLITTNVGQQGTGWTVINQVAEVMLHTCVQLYFL